MTAKLDRLWEALGSLKLTIVCLALLMVLVVACTLAQVSMGTLGAVNAYMRAFLVWWPVPGTDWSIAIFPGGALVGLVLVVNLVVAQVRRLELSWRKAGLWVIHAGLILLFAGEFVSGAFQVDSQLMVEEGQTVDFIESPRDHELVLTDVTDPSVDEVWGIPTSRLASGGTVEVPGSPVAFRVKGFFPNAELSMRDPSQPSGPANQGVGAGVTVTPRPQVATDDRGNLPATFVEAVAGGRSYGTWLASPLLGAPQGFIHEGRSYTLALRPRREQLSWRLTLKKFSHDVYAGTNIPKNFSSLVHLSNPAKGEERDVLIFMNQPLRYDGRAFYQASFGKNDTLSILQVVENPGWLLPYISCVLVGIGLLVHFGIALRRSTRRGQTLTAEA